MKRALCIWLPNWPLQRLAAARAELSQQAVVLYELHASGGAKVAAYCPHLATAAAALWEHNLPGATTGSSSSVGVGIRVGMPLAEATSLVSQSRANVPHSPLHLELIDPAADRLAIDELAEWSQRFSPTVGVEEAAAPETLLLDVTGLGRLFGGERALARHIVRALGKRGLTARVAVADTLGAAWAVAHFADLTILRCHAHAGVSMPENSDHVDRVKSTGGRATRGTRISIRPGDAILKALSVPLIIPAGQAQAAIAPLPPAALRLPAETCDLLADLGLRRIDQLAALPRETLPARLGPLVLKRFDQATGAAAEAIAARAVPDQWLFQWLFEHPTGRREMIEWAVGQLVARACKALARGRRGMLRLECRFELECRSPERFVVGFYRASASERHVGELLRLKLERLRFREPLVAIHLRVLAIDRLEFRQREFFAGELSRESPRELAALVDRLSNRLGPHAVVRPWLLASAQPEFACQYRPLSTLFSSRERAAPRRSKKKIARKPGSKASRAADSASARKEQQGDRPLHLEPEPRPLDVLSVVPDGPPVKFRFAGHDRRITRSSFKTASQGATAGLSSSAGLAENTAGQASSATPCTSFFGFETASSVWGPERIETGWWRGGCVRRDYYQVETTRGQRYWLFRELNTGRWFLHGMFV